MVRLETYVDSINALCHGFIVESLDVENDESKLSDVNCIFGDPVKLNLIDCFISALLSPHEH